MPFFSSRKSSQPVNNKCNLYQHKPLPSLDAPYIRLLQLQPTKSAGEFIGTLEIHRLDDPQLPSYTALSYAWGSEPVSGQARHTINLVSQPDSRGRFALGALEIRPNLHAALLGLRPNHDYHYVWIDSVCINQTDQKEKNHQVKLMGQLYSNADRVVASLCSEHDTARDHEQINHAFWIMQQAVNYQPVASNRNRSQNSQDNVIAWFNSSIDGIKTKQDHVQAMESLATFIGRPYWTRLWIIQEIIMGRSVTVQYNTDLVSMLTVEDFFHRLTRNPYDAKRSRSLHALFDSKFGNADFFSFPGKVLAEHRMNRRFGRAVPNTLSALLPQYASSQCYLPADHVYGLYNLLGSHRAYLKIDYDQNDACRIASLLQFMQQYEQIGCEKLAAWAVFLRSMLMDQNKQPKPIQSADLKVLNSLIKTSLHVLGNAELMRECSISKKARPSIQSMPNMSVQICSRCADSWQMNDTLFRLSSSTQQSLPFFAVAGTELYGVANMVDINDLICQLAGTSLAIVARWSANGDLNLISFATLFTAAEVSAHSNGPLRSTFRARNSLEQGRTSKSIKLNMPVQCLLSLAEQACMHDERHPVLRWQPRSLRSS